MSLHYIHRLFLCFSITSILMFSQTGLAATLKSTVDRYRIGEDETLNLTITLDDASFSGSPDLAGLDSNFQVLGSSSSSSTQIINGSISSRKEWRYTLLPKKGGKLVIPSFKLKGSFSDAIEIEVLNQSQNNNASDTPANGASDLFLEESVDKKEAYVQERITLTLRFYTAVEITRPEIPDPSFPDFMVQKLGQSEYETKRDGRKFYVLEYKYALFANKSGKVTLPKQRFQINQVLNSAPRSMFDIPGFDTPTTQLRVLSTPDIGLTIKPQVENPAAPYWLPSEDVSISDNWPAQQTVNTGTPLTRTIEIRALGNLAAHIPPLVLDNIPGLKMYAEQPELNTSRAGDNLLGSRKENIAIVPTQAGTYILPSITIHWFDTKTRQFKTSSIPERTLTITGAAQNVSPSIPENTPAVPQVSPATQNLSEPLSSLSNTVAPNSTLPFYLNSYLWMCVSALLLLLWIVTLVFLLRKKNSSGIIGEITTADARQQQSLKEAFKVLKLNCAANDAKKSREAIIRWAQVQWPEAQILTLADVKIQINDKTFNKLADELDCALYRETAFWNGKAILEFIQCEKFTNPAHDTSGRLPKLYEGLHE